MSEEQLADDVRGEAENHFRGAAMESPAETQQIAPEPPRPSAIRFVFFGPDGLRPGWGLLLFFLMLVVLGVTATLAIRGISPHPVRTPEQRAADASKPQPPAGLLQQEGLTFAMIALVSWTMSRIERRPVGAYGFGGRRKLSRFFTGFAWGLVSLAVLVGALWKSGLLVFDRRLLFGAAALRYGAIWLLGFLCVGLLEEYFLRGYVMYTLSRGMASLYQMLFEIKDGTTLGFWTAAVLLSFLFGAGHSSNPGESPIGLASAGLIGLIFCLTLWRTGSLWWALGFHAAWDWAQSFVFGVADSGMMVEGHLFATHPVGKVLWSGGATGPEGCALILPVLAVLTVVIAVTLPGREWPVEA